MKGMDAGMLACPNCGAPAAPSAVQCTHCRVQLATLACPGCFGMNFVGAQHCSHCGAKVFRPAVGETLPAGTRACPRCRVERLSVTAIGSAFLEECTRCGGLWVDAGSFKSLCEHREERAAYVGPGSPLPSAARAVEAQHVAYLPCPECGKVMNRVNFARHSGVIVDVCRTHGTWFDKDELREVLEFIQSGGLEEARQREVQRLERENQRLRSQRDTVGAPGLESDARHQAGLLEVAGDLLGWLMK
jgi:Zn-finger nucleic acid-binding protein